MSEIIEDSLPGKINLMLDRLSSAPSRPSMFRVRDRLRRINPKAYDPDMIAIGPFHRSNVELQEMEEYKVRYLSLFLVRLGNGRTRENLERCVTTIRNLEPEARKYYAEDIKLNEDEFVQMLILDGCFIIVFLRKFYPEDTIFKDANDPIFNNESTKLRLLHDLMVFENQIPFFIIDRLFNMIYINNEDIIDFLIRPLLANGISPVYLPKLPAAHKINAPHLLGIVHFIQLPSAVSPEVSDQKVNIISAVELKEAGISFKKSEYGSIFHIELKNKALIIPEWTVSDSTESLIRNLIAYEYHLTGSDQKYVTDYVFFIKCLVHSPKDAKLLRQSGIINNILGSDEMLYHLINHLGKNIILSANFSYYKIFSGVKLHCGRTRNIWMAILRREYFNSPWALISVFAAITLLLLAFTQTTFAILSYCNDLKGN